MARLLAAAHDQRGAVRAYTRALRFAPNDASLLAMRGCAHDALGESQAALADFDRSLAIFPPQIDIWVARGCCRHELGLHDLAIEDFTRALAARPREAHVLRRRGEVHFDGGRPDEALADLTRALELAPEDPLCHWLIGLAHEAKGDFPTALAALDRAVLADPTSAQYVLSRANARCRAGDLTGFREDFARVIALCPADVEMLVLHARVCAGEGDLDRARSELDRAIALEPDNAAAWHGRADVHRERRDFHAALADELRAVELEPGSAEYRSWLGRYRHAANPSPEGDAAALANLAAAINLAPRSSTAWAHRAAFFSFTNRHAEALPDYDRCIELAPAKASFHFHRAVCRRHVGDDEALGDAEASLHAALADLDGFLAKDPDPGPTQLAEAHWWRGDTLEHLGDQEGALAAYTLAIEAYPASIDAHESRAILRDEMGDAEGAAEDFARVEELRGAEEDERRTTQARWRLEASERPAHHRRVGLVIDGRRGGLRLRGGLGRGRHPRARPRLPVQLGHQRRQRRLRQAADLAREPLEVPGERVPQLAGAGPAVVAAAGQRPVDGAGDVLGDPGREAAQRDRRLADNLADEGVHVLAREPVRREGVNTADELGHHHAEGEGIAPPVHPGPEGELLRRHVRDRPQGAVPRGQEAGAVEFARAQIQHADDAVVAEVNVLQLDVAVDRIRMDRGEPRRHVGADAQRPGEREPPEAPLDRAERVAAEQNP